MSRNIRRISSDQAKVITKGAFRDLDLNGFDILSGWEPSEGKVLTRTRAISARVNQNFDGWPADELKKSYKTFLGKPVFVNHVNDDPRKARGLVVASRYVENGADKYIEVIQEVDAKKFPKLAYELSVGGLDSVSMGCEAKLSKCSYCGNVARDVSEMCDHVLRHKGHYLPREAKNGIYEEVLVYEECRDLGFFELSYVFDPADETALVSNVVTASRKSSDLDDTRAPSHVDTLRDEEEDVEDFFVDPPDQLKDPDVNASSYNEGEDSEDQRPSSDEDTETDDPHYASEKGKNMSRKMRRSRRYFADDSRNDQGEQEEVFISQTPGFEDAVVEDEPVNQSSEEGRNEAEKPRESLDNLEAQRRAALRTLARVKKAKKRIAEQCDDLDLETSGDISRDVEDDDVEVSESAPNTAPKDASRKTRRKARRKIADEDVYPDFDGDDEDDESEGGDELTDEQIDDLNSDIDGDDGDIDVDDDEDDDDDEIIAKRRAKRTRRPRKTRRSARRRVADEKLDVAEPDGRADVEAPVSDTTDDEAQDSQFDRGDFGNNAGDDVADPDLTTDQNWAPGEGKKESSFKRRASQIEALRLAEAMVEVGLEPHEDRWKLASNYTKLPSAIVADRTKLLARVANVKQAESKSNVRKASKGPRGSVPSGLGKAPGLKKSAASRSDDSLLFF